ncbi:MAG: PhzF family phenazine biosynthesis protein [Peptoniphilus sp.]|nr:PhzF family phenazine biosynthesis protein [Peptoniphilus sp.]MDY3119085.1 PhzF family phenazine biosynthesis protein [Peptoniphilus sp.]
MKQFIVDTFAENVFKGNPAAVCLPDRLLTDALMLAIARENNLSETAFVVKDGERYILRSFTPEGEVDFCGHATFAAAYIVFHALERVKDTIFFDTKSGTMPVTRKGDLFSMDLPAYELHEVPVTDTISDAVGARPQEAYMGRDLLLVMDEDFDLANYTPDSLKLKTLDGVMVHLTQAAKGEYDCISRSFAPKLGVDEDPVCGSGHCHISVYWSEKLNKPDILAYQASRRGGILETRVANGHVNLAGHAVLFYRGQIHI